MEPFWSQPECQSQLVVSIFVRLPGRGDDTNMTQETFPEIKAATEALEARVALTEAEIVQMKDEIKAKKALVKSWRKALAAFHPRPPAQRKKAAASK